MFAAVVREHGEISNILLEDDYPDPVCEPGWVKIAVRAERLMEERSLFGKIVLVP